MAADAELKAAHNICVLAIGHGISVEDYERLVAYFPQAKFTLIVPHFDEIKPRPQVWTDGARSGFMKILTISRRMSWSSFDLVINWEQGTLDNILCFLLLPRPKIINKHGIFEKLTEFT